MTKITKATLKSFVRKNEGKIFVNVRSEFDGMVDGCVSSRRGFQKVESINLRDYVVYSRNFFYEYNEEGFNGIRVSNCCGDFIIATQAAA